MPTASRIRSFVAIDVAAPIRAALRELQEELARARADVGWVRADGLHMTLKFLGAVEAPRLERLHGVLATALASQPGLCVGVRGLGAFPSLRRPRVLWVALEGGGLAEMAARVDDALAGLGFGREQRAFTPHLTLGRVRSLRGWPALEELFKAHLGDDFGDCEVDAVTIYRSTLRPDGAVYTPLWTIALRQHKERATDDTRR